VQATLTYNGERHGNRRGAGSYGSPARAMHGSREGVADAHWQSSAERVPFPVAENESDDAQAEPRSRRFSPGHPRKIFASRHFSVRRSGTVHRSRSVRGAISALSEAIAAAFSSGGKSASNISMLRIKGDSGGITCLLAGGSWAEQVGVPLPQSPAPCVRYLFCFIPARHRLAWQAKGTSKLSLATGSDGIHRIAESRVHAASKS